MFRFKQFSIEDSDCGMKIGVDGVLLGAWIRHDSPKNILDVGTGSGLVALMMAQKFPDAHIQCVEIERDAIKQASENFKDSPFDNLFTTHEIDFLRFNAGDKFDIIVSNLPYYDDGGIFEDNKRDLARSSKHLPLKDFLLKSELLLSDQGAIYFIYPNINLKGITELAQQVGLNVNTILQIQGNPTSKAKRSLFKLSKQVAAIGDIHQHLTIEIKRGEYTKEYKNLCKDFYLKF